MTNKQELIQAIKEDRLMDYISSNYYKFTKEELKTVIAELDYSYHEDMKRQRAKRNFDYMLNELDERIFEDDVE